LIGLVWGDLKGNEWDWWDERRHSGGGGGGGRSRSRSRSRRRCQVDLAAACGRPDVPKWGSNILLNIGNINDVRNPYRLQTVQVLGRVANLDKAWRGG
jgi:hypothetical protein